MFFSFLVEELTSVIINANSSGSSNFKDFSGRFDVPIFTEEFLDQNKGWFINIYRTHVYYIYLHTYHNEPIVFLTAREAELRRLRKANVEFEEQNTILQKHIADMFSAKERLEAELGQDELRTQTLHRHLQAIKQTLASSLASVPLPGQ